MHSGTRSFAYNIKSRYPRNYTMAIACYSSIGIVKCRRYRYTIFWKIITNRSEGTSNIWKSLMKPFWFEHRKIQINFLLSAAFIIKYATRNDIPAGKLPSFIIFEQKSLSCLIDHISSFSAQCFGEKKFSRIRCFYKNSRVKLHKLHIFKRYPFFYTNTMNICTDCSGIGIILIKRAYTAACNNNSISINGGRLIIYRGFDPITSAILYKQIINKCILLQKMLILCHHKMMKISSCSIAPCMNNPSHRMGCFFGI